MEQLVRVKQINEDGTAQVVHIRESACSGDCHKCSGCGAVKQAMLIDAFNPIGAQPGDMVEIRSETGPVLAGAVVLYLVPLALFFAGYLLGDALWGMGPLMGCLAFVLGFGIAMLYDRLVARKQKQYIPLCALEKGLKHTEKGDNDLD